MHNETTTQSDLLQSAIQVLHDRRSALDVMIRDAHECGAYNKAMDLDIRHAEVCGMLSAIRNVARRDDV